MLKQGNYNMIDVERYEIFRDELSKITVDSGNPVQILYQSGWKRPRFRKLPFSVGKNCR